ncbi:MAG: hypothetical protein JSW47_21370, partial [Phycisphaerales bacterium]
MSEFNILEQTVAPPEGQAVKEVLFTFKNGKLYAITPKWPDRKLKLKDIVPDNNMVVTFLETGEKLPWKVVGNDLVITIPDFDTNRMNTQYAHVFRLSGVKRKSK